MRDPLEGVLNDPATQLNERSKPSVRLAALMATCQLYDYKQMFLTESSSKFTTDRVWEGKIKGIAKDASSQSVCPALLEIAIQSRREGDWQRWQIALDLALSMSPNKDVTESILAELESDDVDVDELAEHVQRASQLIELCRERIGKAKLRIEEVVSQLEAD